MARYSELDNHIWQDILEYSRDGKILYIYLMGNSLIRDSGIYRVATKTMSLFTGIPERSIPAALDEIKDKVIYDPKTITVFVIAKLKRRIEHIDRNKNLLKSIAHDLRHCGSELVINAFNSRYGRGLEGAWKGLGSPSIPLPTPLPLPLDVVVKDGGVGEEKEPEPESPEIEKPVAMFDAWNKAIETALSEKIECRMPKVIELSDDRAKKCRTRLSERPLVEWESIFSQMARTPFLNGKNKQGWRANFDWIIASAGNGVRVLEGKYISANDVPKVYSEALLKVLQGWKLIVGIPEDEKSVSEWDKLNLDRCAEPAQKLLDFFAGDYLQAVDCAQDVYEELKKSKLDCTLNTILSRAFEWRNKHEKNF